MVALVGWYGWVMGWQVLVGTGVVRRNVKWVLLVRLVRGSERARGVGATRTEYHDLVLIGYGQ